MKKLYIIMAGAGILLAGAWSLLVGDHVRSTEMLAFAAVCLLASRELV